MSTPATVPLPIQSTAGAIPMRNEKGELYMQKVKVQRYVAGKRPEYARESDSELSSDAEGVRGDEDGLVGQRGVRRGMAVGLRAKVKEEDDDEEEDEETWEMTAEELADPRLRRLLALKMKAEEESENEESEEEDRVMRHKRLRGPEMLSSGMVEAEGDLRVRGEEEEEEEEIDDDEMERRRELIRQRALLLRQRQEEELATQETDEEEEEEVDFSEEEYTDSEDEAQPRLKPVFVRKRDRVTLQKQKQDHQEREIETEVVKVTEERRKQTLKLVSQETKREAEEAKAVEDALNAIDSDGGNEEEVYEAWKVRELKRIRRDRDQREQIRRDKEETERIHAMTEEERREEFRRNPKMVTNKAPKTAKYKFLQKYYHRGAFFVSHDEEQVYKRDYAEPTLEDHFDKTVLPKVMQVKNFGRAGRTKYTHLVDQDTTQFDNSPWVADTSAGARGGGMKQIFEKPSIKKKKM